MQSRDDEYGGRGAGLLGREGGRTGEVVRLGVSRVSFLMLVSPSLPRYQRFLT